MSNFNNQDFLSKVDAIERRIEKAKLLHDGEEKAKEIKEIDKILAQLKTEKSIWKHEQNQGGDSEIKNLEEQESKKEEVLLQDLEQQINSL